MPLFPIREKPVEFRGTTFVVRELTYAEKIAWLAKRKENPELSLPLLVVQQTISGFVGPTPTPQSLVNEPGELLEVLGTTILELSGIKFGEPGDPKAES